MSYPLLWLIASAFKPEDQIFNNLNLLPTEWVFDNFSKGWTALRVSFTQFYANSFLVAGFAVVGNLLACSLTAFAFARLEFRFKRLWFALMMGTLMLPYHVTLVPQYILFLKLGWVNTFLPLIVPRFLAVDAFFVFLMVQFFRGIPREIDEAAIMDGCGPWRIYWRIMLPLSTPVLATAAIFSFIFTWDDFLGPLIYLSDMRDYTVPLALRDLRRRHRRIALRPALRHVQPVAGAGLRRLSRLPAPDHPRRRPRRAEALSIPPSTEARMAASPGFAFAVIGINHGHIYGQVDVMLEAGCRLKSFHARRRTISPRPIRQKYPARRRASPTSARSSKTRRSGWSLGAGILAERAPMAVRAMRHGKDVMLDKPGATTLDQLAELRRAQAETGRILSILYSEHYTQPATVAAGELVKAGAVGRVLQTIGLGPHKVGNYRRPDWFLSRERTGGILCDIGSHQVEQFLFFTGAEKAEVAASQIANFDHPEKPEFEDFGQILLVAERGDRLHPGRLVHPGRPAGLGRRPALHPRHRGHDRAQEIHRHRRTAGRRPSLPRRPQGRPPHRLLADEDHLWRRAARRRLEPHRDGDEAEPLLLRDRARAEGAGASDADCRQAPAGARGVSRASRSAWSAPASAPATSRAIESSATLFGRGALRHRRRAREEGRRRVRHPAGSSPISTTLLRLDLDIVDICTPSALHFAQARKALLAGFNVVVEKPFASSLAEADALAELEKKSGKRVSPIFQYRFSDGIAQLLHLRARGFVGKAYAATVETHWRRLPAYYANPWRGRWATELGGCLTTHAIHAHDILTTILGPMASVYARTATRVNPIETEDCAAAVARDGGRRASPRSP